MERDPLSITYTTTVQRLAQDLAQQKEDWLKACISNLGLTLEEFAAGWVVEEYPTRITNVAQSVVEDELLFQIRQNYRIRPKTKEELKRDQTQLEADASTD